MDVQILIDDFGTGYSSLGYLQQFPVSALKIDRSFIKKIGAEGEDSEIVRAIVNLAHNLNMDVVAEGVEMTEHLPILKALKCKYAQGYLFSHPLNNRDIEDLLSSADTLSPGRVETHYPDNS
jgi:EAL domain-containing protein (putative c-di-GMP-specific phosphodiesterase class I)